MPTSNGLHGNTTTLLQSKYVNTVYMTYKNGNKYYCLYKNKIRVVIISFINTVQFGSVLQYFFIILLSAVFVSLTSWGALFQAFPDVETFFSNFCSRVIFEIS